MTKTQKQRNAKRDTLTDTLSQVTERASELARRANPSRADQKQFLDECGAALAASADPSQLGQLAASMIYALARKSQETRKLQLEIIAAATTARRLQKADAHTIQTHLDGTDLGATSLIDALLPVGIQLGKGMTARAGGAARADKYAKIKAYAIKLYHQKKYSSAQSAANDLWDKVLAESERLHRPLSADSGFDTLLRWLREERRKSKK